MPSSQGRPAGTDRPTPDLDARYVERRTRRTPAAPDAAWAAVRRTAGEGTGLTAYAWAARNLADRLVGGEGRAWRVVAEEAPRRIALEAVARLPGRATLELTVEPDPDRGTGSLVHQVNTFAPDGPLGRAYWHALGPAHRLVFARMLGDTARAAARR
ncbi:DUF2867 domain-containing protein [Nocardioidaceae bacterium]|nr:DUF2867 domain-containing protein [Nocardioidaceae bacterium]